MQRPVIVGMWVIAGAVPWVSSACSGEASISGPQGDGGTEAGIEATDGSAMPPSGKLDPKDVACVRTWAGR